MGNTVEIHVRSLLWFAAGIAVALIASAALLIAWQASAAPGDDDSTFAPIANCRLFDFRSGADNVGPKDTPLGPGESNVYAQQVTGTNGNCTIPNDAVGVAMNVTIVGPTAQSNLRVFPADIPTPLASNLNWLPGQSPTPNKVDVQLSATGAIKLFNFRGEVDVVADVVGYYTSSSLTEIASRLMEVEQKLASVSVADIGGQPTVRFSGVNVQVVDGTGDTACDTAGSEACNAVGNVIVGYNEEVLTPVLRSGSHNLVVGSGHRWTSYGGFVAGTTNTINGRSSSVLGGFGNTASGPEASIAGGSGNRSSGSAASVSGGSGNEAMAQNASVSGGQDNDATGALSSVSGGAFNRATETAASVAGGRSNTAGGNGSAVAGGSGNRANGLDASVAGGLDNLASGAYESVAGGDDVVCNAGGVARVCGDGQNGPL